MAERDSISVTQKGSSATLSSRTDVSERKRPDEMLRQSEERYRSLVEAAPDAVFTVSVEDGTFTSLNPAFEKITGFSRMEWLGRSFVSIIHRDDQTTATEEFNQTLRGEISKPIEMRVLSRSGEYLVWEISITPLIEGGRVVAVVGFARDITERKQAERLLLMLSNSSAVGIYVVQSGKFKYVNSRFQELLGYDEDELLGINSLTLVFPQDRVVVRKNAIKMLKGERSLPYEYRYLTKGHEIKWVLEKVSSIQYQGKPAVLGNFMDITEHKQLAEEVRRKELEVATAQEMVHIKSHLLSIVSHELRTPLATIKGYSTMLLEYDRRLHREEKHRYLESIDRTTDRLTELVDRLLDMSRLDAGLFRLAKSPTELSKLIDEAVAEAQLRSPEHCFRVERKEELPVLDVDSGRIRQVLDNLLENAIRYSEKGTAVVVLAKREARKLKISISDRGKGIPANDIDKVFDPLYRLEDRLAQDPRGMGLGLPLCKGLVEAHGGHIWVKSKLRRGSTFCFTIPLSPASERSSHANESREK